MSQGLQRELLAPAVSRAVSDVLRSPGLEMAANASRPRESIAGHRVRLPVTAPGEDTEREAKQAESRPWAHRDFASVRVHADTKAAQAAQSLHARAFTVGDHMVFGPGEFAPHRDAGRRLLAHELAHARQPGSEDRLACAPVEGVQVTGITIDRADIETEAGQSFWVETLSQAFQPVTFINDTRKRFDADTEERDAVLSSVVQQKPKGKVASETVVNLSVDPRNAAAGSKKLLYKATFSPPAKGVAKDGAVSVQFLEEGKAATEETPAPPSSFTAGFSISSPPKLVAHLNAHPDENRQLLFFLQNAPAKFDQLVKTSETTASSKLHESWFLVSGVKDASGSLTSFHVTLLSESAPVLQNPPAGYHDKDREDFEIEKLQGQKKDALGQINGLNALPTDEQLSVKYVIDSYFTGGIGAKAKTRNSEVDVIVPIAGKTTNVDYTLRFQPNNDVDVERVGEPDSNKNLEATGINIARVEGFAANSTVSTFGPWVHSRYPSVNVTGTTLQEQQVSVNQDMTANAGTDTWFPANYGITILGDTAAAARLHTVHGRATIQTAGMGTFKPEELKSLEFALETMSAEELKLLRDVQFARQKQLLELTGTAKHPAVTAKPKTSGDTFQSSSGERTIVIYDSVTLNDKALFLGGKGGVREQNVETYTHELGHALESKNNIETSFKAFVKGKIKPITSYAASKPNIESFAEAFAYYQNDPEWMKNNQPDLYRWFEYLKEHGSPQP